MYVRLFRDSHGKMFLQQLLKFQEPSKNGKPSEVVQKWENVPTISTEKNEALSLPIGSSCGVMIFDCEEEIFSSVIEGHKKIQTTYIVSALDIYKISMVENGIQVFTRDKMALKVKMAYHEFLELMVSLLNNFKIVKFDINGKLIKGE